MLTVKQFCASLIRLQFPLSGSEAGLAPVFSQARLQLGREYGRLRARRAALLERLRAVTDTAMSGRADYEAAVEAR